MSRFPVLIAALLAWCVVTPGYAAPDGPVTPVLITQDNGTEGAGIILQGKAGCVVATADHVVGDAVDLLMKSEVGAWAGDRFKGDPNIDFALVKWENADQECTQLPTKSEIDRALQLGDKPTLLVPTSPSGRQWPIPITLERFGSDYLVISTPSQMALNQGMSGSPILVGGQPVGVLLAAGADSRMPCPPKGSQPVTLGAEMPARWGCAIRLDYAVRLVAQDVFPEPTADGKRSSMVDALAVLKTATEMRPTGDIGQVSAIRAFIDSGKSVDGLDLSGIGFSDANFSRLKGLATNFSFSDFTKTNLTEANLSAADFTFTILTGTKFEHAVLTNASGAYVRGEEADFKDANLSRVGWRGADLKASSFVNSDLSGASFTFSDLRDADFRGATITDLVLAGSDLRGAKFDQTSARSIDVTGALFDDNTFPKALERALCSSESYGNVQNPFFEVTGATMTQRGLDYDDLLEYAGQIVMDEGINRFFPQCPDRTAKLGETYDAMIDIANEDSGESVHQRIRVETTRAVLQSGNRRSAAIAYAKSVVQNSTERAGMLPTSNHYYRDRTQRIEAQIAQNLKAYRFKQGMWLTGETTALLLAAANVAEMPSGRDLAENRFSEERRRADLDRLQLTHLNGPPVFPKDMSKLDMSPKIYDLFSAWALNVKTALPKSIRLSLLASNRSDPTRWGSVIDICTKAELATSCAYRGGSSNGAAKKTQATPLPPEPPWYVDTTTFLWFDPSDDGPGALIALKTPVAPETLINGNVGRAVFEGEISEIVELGGSTNVQALRVGTFPPVIVMRSFKGALEKEP